MVKTLIILSLICSVWVGYLLIYKPPKKTTDYMNQGTKNAYSNHSSYDGIWLKNELAFIVFSPSNNHVSMMNSQWPDTVHPGFKGISLYPNGLFYGAKKIDTSGDNKFFVINASKQLQGFKVPKNLWENFKRSNIENLESSPAWKIVEAEIASTSPK